MKPGCCSGEIFCNCFDLQIISKEKSARLEGFIMRLNKISTNCVFAENLDFFYCCWYLPETVLDRFLATNAQRSPVAGRHGNLIFSCLLFVLFDFFFQITESWLKIQNLIVWFDLYHWATLWLVWGFFPKNFCFKKKNFSKMGKLTKILP